MPRKPSTPITAPAVCVTLVAMVMLLACSPPPRTSPAGLAREGVSSSAASGGGEHVVAVGDIASASGLDDAVADRVAVLDPDHLLLLGDIAYPNGSAADFASYFDPDWSRFADIWIPVPGNHEFRLPRAEGYREYFGIPTGRLVSSTRVGDWVVIGLNSETPHSSGQLAWLREALAAHDGQPAIVMWHRPRYSSGEHGDIPATDVLWDTVKADADVRLVLWGHDHNFERMSVPVAGESVMAIVAGTGGGALRETPVLVDRPWRDFYVDQTTGVLDLRLRSSSFSWAYVTAGGSVLDSGSTDLTARKAQVLVKRVSDADELRVNVNPNQAAGYWRFTVQRQRTDGTWVKKDTYRTRGSAHTRTLDLRKGTYRVRVHAKFGFTGSRSRPVTLKR